MTQSYHQEIKTAQEIELCQLWLRRVVPTAASLFPTCDYDGCYTRMLKKVYNIKGITKIRNERLYKGLSPVSDIIKARRLRLAGHTFRDKTSPAHLTVTWDPSHGTLSRGRPAHTLIDTLLRDTGLDNIRELECCMSEKNEWRNRVSCCQTSG